MSRGRHRGTPEGCPQAAAEGDVTEGEDAAVLGDHQVAVLAGDDAGDRLVELVPAHGAMEAARRRRRSRRRRRRASSRTRRDGRHAHALAY